MSTATGVPSLTDGDLTLRAYRLDDVPRIVEQCRDPESVRWTRVPVPYAEADAERFVRDVAPAGWADGSQWRFAVEVGGRFAGSVALRDEALGRAEVVYGSHPDVRGTGALERALRLLLAWGFDERGLQTVTWRAVAGNWPSRRLTWRLGFAVEGTLRSYLPQREQLRDAWVGTLLREDPRQPRGPWLRSPVLEGEGVRLRPLASRDVARLVEGIGDPQTQHWLAFLPRDPGPEHVRAYLEQATERLATGHTITWAAADLDDDRLLGVVGLYRMSEEPELGYWTHPAARGRGLTRRAAALAVEHAFTDLGLPRLAAYASAPNRASRGVLTALGFRPTGLRRAAARTGDGTMVDLAGYDLLAGEWPSGSPAGGRSRPKPTASTANPASDSTMPTSSGER